MRRALGLVLLALLVCLLSPTTAHARDVIAVPTATTLTGSASGTTVNLRAVVSVESGPDPEGTIEITEGGEVLDVVTLTTGPEPGTATATWSTTATVGTHSYVAGYLPASGDWTDSTSEPVGVEVSRPGPCVSDFVDGCGQPYRIGVRGPRSIVVGDRARFRISFDGPGSVRQPGVATVSMKGPRRFIWAAQTRVERRPATIRTPRLTRPGTYKLRVDARLDQGLERTETIKVRVVRRPKVG